MGKRLYCGNLPFSASADDLRELFAEDGRTVTDVHIVTDRETGRSRGFAFVELGSDEEAEAARSAIDGRNWGGRPLSVKEAQDRAPRPGFGGPRGAGPRGPRPGFRPGGEPTVERRPAFAPGRDFGSGQGRDFGGGRRDFGRPSRDFGRGVPEPHEIPDYLLEQPAPQPAEYAPPDDVDYRDRGDRGKRGRDRRGGRRRGGDDFGDW